MKKIFFVLSLLTFSISNISFAQYLSQTTQQTILKLKGDKSLLSKSALPSTGASVGFNLGVASIEGEVGFAIGAYAELQSKGFSFTPQANYWNANKQTNFELAGLARFYLGPKPLIPYIDGGLGVNFFNSEKTNFTKISVIVGGGVELTNLSSSFNLVFDGKYKLIVNDKGNLSCFIFTAGMEFPLK